VIKQHKLKLVQNLQNTLTTVKSIIILDINKVSAEELQNIRRKLIEKNIFFKVIKNKLIKHAFNSTRFQVLSKDIIGQIALMWCLDENKSIVATKLIYDIKNDKNILNPICGFINNKKVNEKYLEYISNIPNINILRFKLLFILINYSKKVIKSVNYLPSMIINILKNKK